MSLPTPHVRFVLCEGSHDLGVIRKVLEHRHGYKKSKVKLTDLPEPLGKFVLGWIEKHFQSVKVSSVGFPEKPNFSMVMTHPTDDVHLAFFTAGGGLNNDVCRTWLADARLEHRST